MRIEDSSGGPAPGRQVLEVTVTDPDGRMADETGLYRAERGVAEIPLRFARDDPEGSLFRRWRIHVRERTSGLEGSDTWRL